MGFFDVVEDVANVATFGVYDAVGGIGGLTGQNQADAAIAAQTAAAREANATQKYIFDEQRKDAQPWRSAGISALAGLQDNDFKKDFTMSDFEADPGYAFRMAEGQKAIERSAAARGGLNSGATMKSLAQFSQNTASNEYQNAYNRFNSDRDRRFNRMSSIAGVGQTANSQVAAAGQNYGNNVSSNQIGLGNAIGAAHIAQGNQMSNLIGQGAGAAALAFSDLRLKKSVEKLPTTLFKDVPTYAFEYINEKFGKGRFVGVMAQDLLAKDSRHPAVIETPEGYMVDYSKLEVA